MEKVELFRHRVIAAISEISIAALGVLGVSSLFYLPSLEHLEEGIPSFIELLYLQRGGLEDQRFLFEHVQFLYNEVHLLFD